MEKGKEEEVEYNEVVGFVAIILILLACIGIAMLYQNFDTLNYRGTVEDTTVVILAITATSVVTTIWSYGSAVNTVKNKDQKIFAQKQLIDIYQRAVAESLAHDDEATEAIGLSAESIASAGPEEFTRLMTWYYNELNGERTDGYVVADTVCGKSVGIARDIWKIAGDGIDVVTGLTRELQELEKKLDLADAQDRTWTEAVQKKIEEMRKRLSEAQSVFDRLIGVRIEIMNWLFLEEKQCMGERVGNWGNDPHATEKLSEWGVNSSLLQGIDIPNPVQLLASPKDYTPLVTALGKVRYHVPPFDWESTAGTKSQWRRGGVTTQSSD